MRMLEFVRDAAAPANVRRQVGATLIAVLWMVSALSLLAAALAGGVRTELRVARQFADHAAAAALGDAAIRLAVHELLYGETSPPEIRLGRYRVGDRAILVRVLPGAGFINVNTAPEALLRDLFFHGAGMDVGAAAVLAQRVVEWRTAAHGTGLQNVVDDAGPNGANAPPPRRAHFAVPEDLLQVAELDWGMFDRIRPLLTVHPSGGTGVNPRLAKPEVLAILANGDRAVVEHIMSRRKAGDPLLDMTGLEQRHLSSAAGASWRIEAFVPVAGGGHLLRAQWVALGVHERLPWRTLAIEPVISTAPPH